MTAAPHLADGIAEYIEAVRVTPAGPRPPLETARLLADRQAHRIAIARPHGMKVTTSFVVGNERETPVRIYRPAGDGPQPALVYFHGGGFTTGSLETYDPLATALAEASGATLVSAHYPRLPEATPRAIIEDSFDALRWTFELAEWLNVDPARIGVAGDSAGAFIAAQLAILARDRGGPTLACQVLCYGMFDIAPDRPAYRAATDPVLTLPIIEATVRTYLECDARDPSGLPPPLRCADPRELPPAILLAAEHDPMREEGDEYAARLREAGIRTELNTARAMPHGFLRAVRFSGPAREEMRRLGRSIRSLL